MDKASPAAAAAADDDDDDDSSILPSTSEWIDPFDNLSIGSYARYDRFMRSVRW
jgi:hypothetical protein